jgi:serine/threonine-protein kinase
MKHVGPLFTLLAGVVLAAGIGIANAMGGGATSPGVANTAGGLTTTATPPPAAPPGTPVSTPDTEIVTVPSAPAADIPARADYTGRVDGGAASIAVSVRDGHVIAYVCDGKKTEAWLAGSAAQGQLQLKDAQGSTLTGTFGTKTVTGTVSAGTQTWKFTAALATKPAGLYRATPKVKGRSAKVGWIVQPDGSQVGILTADGVSDPAPVLDPAGGAVATDGTPIVAQAISGMTGEGDF